MILKMFSIRDMKSELFNPPFYAITLGEAERNFQSLVNDKQASINQYPEDYDLYYVGEYDNNTGKTQPLDTPQHLVKAVQLLKNQAN